MRDLADVRHVEVATEPDAIGRVLAELERPSGNARRAPVVAA